MNNELIKLALDCGLLNYVDHETPRHYFLADWATEEDLYEYTKKVIEMCAEIARNCKYLPEGPSQEVAYQRFLASEAILIKLGIKSGSPISPL